MSRMNGTSVEIQMKELLENVSKEISAAVDESLKEPPKLCKKIIQTNAQALKNTGEYRRGWKIKRHRRTKSAVVYNDTKPGLAHLLEYGHVIKNKNGEYGRAPAHQHIKPAETESVELFVRTLDEKLDSILK